MEIKEMKKVITIPTDLDTIDYRIIEPDNNGPLVKTVCIVGNNFKERVNYAYKKYDELGIKYPKIIIK